MTGGQLTSYTGIPHEQLLLPLYGKPGYKGSWELPSADLKAATPPPSPSDEEYEILSDLPEESVVFLCRLCRCDGDREGESSWRQAVQSFKEDSFRNILSAMKPPSVASSLYSVLQERLQSPGSATVVSPKPEGV